MKCTFCLAESDKNIECPQIGSICIKCCFSISAGKPEIITRLKKEKKMMKDEILAKCASCSVLK